MDCIFPVKCCFNYHGLIVAGNKMLLFTFFLVRQLWYSGLLWYYMNCSHSCSISLKSIVEIFLGIALTMKIALGRMVILTMLILPMYEHRISTRFLVSYISSKMFHSFLWYSSFTSFVKFFPGIYLFTYLVEIINGIAF